ncbi:redoxin domain-containing protein [Pedobacter terrae]|uniref:redoxin domain-containing protein n=1 Tax=Pedobacter terrae TaxID=405671 RepID=UPI002FF94611
MMKLSKIIFSSLLLFSIRAAAQQTFISGNFNSTQKEVKVEDISEFQYLQPQNENLTVKTDTEGNFSIHFDLKKPGYYRIGRNILFLSPGDNLKVAINHLNPNLSTFAGTGHEANNYLKNTPFPKGGSYLESGKNISPYPKVQLENILNKERERSLELNRLKGVNLGFKNLEAARIKADVVNSINSVRYYAPMKLKLSNDTAVRYLDTFHQLAKSKLNICLRELKRPEYLQLPVVRDIARLISTNSAKYQKSDIAFLARVRDWIIADSLTALMTGMEDKAKIAAFSSQLQSIKFLDYRQAAFRTRSSLLKYGDGDLAVDFYATDQDGNAVKLSDWKGKVIFIDLWATWCGPCLQQMPGFEKLKQQYSGNKDVLFVSLSIDENVDDWKKNVAFRKAGGLQWHINRTGLKDYHVINIPRTIIINQHFKIANFQAPAPSSKDNIILLNKLLNNAKGSDNFTINGKLTEVEAGSVLFLSYQGKDDQAIRDSVKLTDGNFHFEGTVRETRMASLLLSHTGSYVVKKNSDQTNILIGNHKLNITGTDSIATASVSGDDENLAYCQLNRELRLLKTAQRAILYQLTPENRANVMFMRGIRQKNEGLVLGQRNIEKAFIMKNPDLMASLNVLKSYAGPVIDVKEIKPLFNGLSANVRQSFSGKELGQTIELLNTISIGQMAPDFKSNDESGKTVSLSDFRGKYVLLDFWASWCAPCRAENPNILSQYERYKNDGLEVLGVSLDAASSKGAWLKAIKDDGLTWTNVSDLKGFESSVANLYHINAIPQNFLIDPSGKIIARNLKAESIAKTLEEYFPK